MREAEPRDLLPDDLNDLVRFTDREIGQGYFSPQKAMSLIENSWFEGKCSSLVLVDKDSKQIVGVRLAFAPGRWKLSHPSQKIHPELWQVPMDQVAYFQSQFLHADYQGQGWGQRLSLMAADRLRQMGAKAIICHSWNESPNDSSRKYLRRVGFEPVIEIPLFWNKINYSCTRCGNPCVCTATEMVKYL